VAGYRFAGLQRGRGFAQSGNGQIKMAQTLAEKWRGFSDIAIKGVTA